MTTTLAPVRSVVVVGFGLIGASVAAALRSRDPDVKLVAVDQASVVAQSDVQARVDEAVSVGDERELAVRFSEADLVVLAAPIHVIEAQLPLALAHSRCVTDCGSTKRRIVDAAANCPESHRFVPGHPMAGASKGGYRAATAELFEGRSWLICPGFGAPEHELQVRQFARFLGALPVELTPEQHDEAVALTSHVPQLLASLLTVLCDEQGAKVAAGPGFASATRVAGGNPAIWSDIFASNADQVAAASAKIAERLYSLSKELAAGDVTGALELLDAAKHSRRGRKVVS